MRNSLIGMLHVCDLCAGGLEEMGGEERRGDADAPGLEEESDLILYIDLKRDRQISSTPSP